MQTIKYEEEPVVLTHVLKENTAAEELTAAVRMFSECQLKEKWR